MLNISIIAGRIVRDPELRTTTGGTTVTNFSVAVDRDRPEMDGTRSVDFLDVVAWRQTAEFIARNFVKGQGIIIQGRLQKRTWTDKDGAKRSQTEIVAANAYFNGDAPRGDVKAADFADLDADDDALPF